MSYVAGNISLVFQSDLTKVRRDLKDLRSEAERPINVGGSSGATVNGGRGLSARTGTGRVRFSSGRTELNEALLRRELTPEYTKESSRYAEAYRRRQQQQMAAIDRVFRVIDRQANAEDRAKARIQAMREQRVNANWERAGLSAQNKAERDQARAEQRLAKAKERQAVAAEKEAAQSERQARQQFIRTDRNARTVRMLQLRSDLAGTSDPYQRQSLIRNVMDGGDGRSPVDPKSPEGLRLRAMYNRAGQRTVIGKFLNKFEGAAIAYAAYRGVKFAGDEFVAQRKFNQIVQYGTREEALSAWEDRARGWQNSPAGGWGLIRKGGVATARWFSRFTTHGVAPESETPAWARNYKDYDEMISDAEHGQRLLAARQGVVEGRSDQRTLFAQSRSMETEAALATERDEFKRRRSEAMYERLGATSSLDQQQQDMEDQIAYAEDSNDQKNYVRLKTRLSFFQFVRPAMESAAQFRQSMKDQATGEDESIAVQRQRNTNQSQILGRQGFSFASDVAAIKSKFAPVVDKNGQIVAFGEVKYTSTQFAGIQESYGLAMQQASLDATRTRILAGGSVRAGLLRLNRDPLGAQLAESNAQEQAAEQGLSKLSPEYWMTRTGAVVQRSLIRQQFADQQQLLDLDLQTRSRRLDALFARSPIGAEVAGIVGQTKSEALSLSQQGYTDEAAQAQRLGIRELQLTKRNYLEAFRGEQIDLNRFDIDNRRDQENPTEVLKTIQSGIEELSKTLNGSGDGGGFIDKLKTMLTDLISN